MEENEVKLEIDNEKVENVLNNNQEPANEISQSTEENTEKTEEPANNEISFGKFKDAQSLLNAYNSLQAEFTKKCQKLSDLEKTSCDNNLEKLPQYKTPDWHQKLGAFLSDNQEATKYSREISEILLNNESIAKNENALELAWAKVLVNNQKQQTTDLQNESYINDYISKNESIKNKIINEYVKSLENNLSPNLINKGAGSSFTVAKQNSPQSLEDAKKLVKAMFKTQ